VDLPGGGAGRSVADIRALESAAAPSRVANAIYGLRYFLGRVFGWDRVQMRREDSLLSRLSERDRGDSEIPPGTPVGSFLLLYQFPGHGLDGVARTDALSRHRRHGLHEDRPYLRMDVAGEPRSSPRPAMRSAGTKPR
jgi:hypothetical protein